MKKIIAMLVCVLMLAACLPTAAFAVDAGITTGDVNGDEAVDVKDVVLMIRCLTGWNVGISEEYGDFDGNGVVFFFEIQNVAYGFFIFVKILDVFHDTAVILKLVARFLSLALIFENYFKTLVQESEVP